MKPKIKKAWRKHLLKVLALLISSLLWFYVLNSESHTADVKMTIQFELPKNKAISKKVDRDIVVKLKGPNAFFRNLRENNNVFLDLSKMGSKRNSFTYTINHDDIPIPFGMQVLDVTPSELKINLERRRSRRVQITPNIVGELPKNLKLQKYTLEPSFINIEGPRSVIENLQELKTRPIDVSTLEGEDFLKVNLADLDSRIMAKLPENGVDFKYVIKPKKANFTLKNIDIFFLAKDQNFDSDNTMVSIDVLVPEQGEISLKKSEVRVIAEIPENVTKKQQIELKAELPEGVHLLQIHPEYIIVAPKKKGKKRP